MNSGNDEPTSAVDGAQLQKKNKRQQSSLDFEIEPDAYRNIETLVESLTAGKSWT